MKRILYIPLLTIFLSALGLSAAANGIVYPWRACPAIVPVENTLEILYDNTSGLPVDSLVLQGPYNRVVLPVEKVETGWFEYDPFTRAAVSNRIRVTIPAGTPEELYDLTVCCGGETQVSKRSVKVLKNYRDPHRFIHISDPHMSRQWIETPEGGYSKELELLDRFIEVADILAPEYILVTGDIIHDYTRFDADSLGWGGVVRSGIENPPLAEEKFKNFFEGAHGYSGVYGFDAPVFSLPGNHDFYGVAADDYPAKAAQWNRLMGRRVYGFSYLDTRILAADNFLGDPVTDAPAGANLSGLQGKVLADFLAAEGPGKIRVVAQHSHSQFDTAFLDRHRIDLLLGGHSHSPREEWVGATPTLKTRPGVVCRSGNIEDWEKTLGFFRIFTIEGDSLRHSAPLRFCENPTAPVDELILNLTLTFQNENTGRSKSNEARLTNRFEVDLPACRVRFVMPKNKRGYRVTGGEIDQTIETDRLTIVDVRTAVKAGSEQVVRIE